MRFTASQVSEVAARVAGNLDPNRSVYSRPSLRPRCSAPQANLEAKELPLEGK